MLSQMTGLLNALQVLAGSEKSGDGRTEGTGFEEVFLSLEAESAATDAEAGEDGAQDGDPAVEVEATSDTDETVPKRDTVEDDVRQRPEPIFAEDDTAPRNLAESARPSPPGASVDGREANPTTVHSAAKSAPETAPASDTWDAGVAAAIPQAFQDETSQLLGQERKQQMPAHYSGPSKPALGTREREGAQNGRPVSIKPEKTSSEPSAAGNARAQYAAAKNISHRLADNAVAEPTSENRVIARGERVMLPASSDTPRDVSLPMSSTLGSSGRSDRMTPAKDRVKNDPISLGRTASAHEDLQAAGALPNATGSGRSELSAPVRKTAPSSEGAALRDRTVSTPAVPESASLQRPGPGNHAASPEYIPPETGKTVLPVREPGSARAENSGDDGLGGPIVAREARRSRGQGSFKATGQRTPDATESTVPARTFARAPAPQETGRSGQEGPAVSRHAPETPGSSRLNVKRPTEPPQAERARTRGEVANTISVRDATAASASERAREVFRLSEGRGAEPVMFEPALRSLPAARQHSADAQRPAVAREVRPPVDGAGRNAIDIAANSVPNSAPQAVSAKQPGTIIDGRFVVTDPESPVSDGESLEASGQGPAVPRWAFHGRVKGAPRMTGSGAGVLEETAARTERAIATGRSEPIMADRRVGGMSETSVESNSLAPASAVSPISDVPSYVTQASVRPAPRHELLEQRSNHPDGPSVRLEPVPEHRTERIGAVESRAATPPTAADTLKSKVEPLERAEFSTPAPEKSSRRQAEAAEPRPVQTVEPRPVPQRTASESANPQTSVPVASVLSPVLDENAPLRGESPLGASIADVQLSAPSVAAQTTAVPPRQENALPIVRQLVEAMSGNTGDETIELKLNPEELGHLRFRMVQGEQGLALTISAERPETLDLLRRHVDQLARHLSELGYDSASFNFGEEQSGHHGRGTTPGGQAAMAEPATVSPPPPAASGGLDIRL
ncbi:flagellar hook-length control protein FliK [Salipiger abyssi]|uniref:flagellar hook-length control protein FliK n=1 Tax=Salipiger abyssi TaxID=1250539 RepID=UPI004057ED28